MEIKIVKQILEWNEDVSDEVKATLSENNVCLINVMGSPGAGKTSLITDIINRLRDTYRIGVIEGDIAGAIDADKIDKMGIPVVQLQTDGACHIEAMSIQHMLSFFNLDELDVLISKYKPDVMAIEKLFYNTNAKTVIDVAQARGVIVLAAQKHGLEIAEYTPLQVKQSVVGYGRAEKKQVQEMMRIMLRLDKVPKPDDTADALAMAICHAHTSGSLVGKLKKYY